MANDAAHTGAPSRGGRNRHRVRGRQAAKRATFPFINSQIVTVAETGDLALTISTIETYVQDMNLVNISTAMHRLAKLTANDTQRQLMLRHHPVLAELLGAALSMLEKAKEGNTSPHCQALSNITWALATLQHADLPLLRAVAALATGRISSFKPFELSATLWAFAKLEAADPAVRSCSAALFTAAAEFVPANADAFTFRCLVMTVWAFGTARFRDSALFLRLAESMLPTVHTANCQELANTAWAFSTAGVRHDQLMQLLASKALVQMGDFKQQELSSLLWSFAAGGFYHEEFFVSAARAVQFQELQPQQMANILWAFSRLRPRHSALQAAVLALLPRCTWMLESFKPQELASVALAAAKCFGRRPGQEVAQVPLPPEVATFFLAAVPLVTTRIRSFSGQSLANLVWSLLSVQSDTDTELVAKLGREADSKAAELEVPALLLLLRSLPLARNAACDASVRALLLEAARRLSTFSRRDLQVLSRICAGLHGLQHLADEAQPLDELRRSCHALSRAEGWAAPVLSEADYQDDSLFDDSPDAEGRGEASGQRANSASRSEASAHASSHDGQGELGRKHRRTNSGSAVLRDPVPYSIKNTFLHVEDQVEPESEDEDDPSRNLPPSLGIIPDSVSPRKLASYRADYQRFRAGKATGAKGEMGSSVAPEEPSEEEVIEVHSPRPPALSDISEAQTSVSHPSSPPASRQLPPPLEFMPQYISPEKLEAYRADYQRFRLGETWGAKGEISNKVSREESPGTILASLRLPPPLACIPPSVSASKLELYRASYHRFRAGNATGAKGEVGNAVALDEPKFIALDKLASCAPSVRPVVSKPEEEVDKVELQVALSVKNTFLHFEASCAGVDEDLEMDGEGIHVAKLPPPLKIIPGNVSAEKLEAYRMDYQKFRAGNATGAKGEVSSSVADGC